MINNNFEWNDFYFLAKSLMKENDIASQRTSISRFYYGCFCSSRDYVIEKELFLSKKNKKIMNSKRGSVHEETRKVFENHPYFQKISRN